MSESGKTGKNTEEIKTEKENGEGIAEDCDSYTTYRSSSDEDTDEGSWEELGESEEYIYETYVEENEDENEETVYSHQAEEDDYENDTEDNEKDSMNGNGWDLEEEKECSHQSDKELTQENDDSEVEFDEETEYSYLTDEDINEEKEEVLKNDKESKYQRNEEKINQNVENKERIGSENDFKEENINHTGDGDHVFQREERETKRNISEKKCELWNKNDFGCQITHVENKKGGDWEEGKKTMENEETGEENANNTEEEKEEKKESYHIDNTVTEKTDVKSGEEFDENDGCRYLMDDNKTVEKTNEENKEDLKDEIMSHYQRNEEEVKENSEECVAAVKGRNSCQSKDSDEENLQSGKGFWFRMWKVQDLEIKNGQPTEEITNYSSHSNKEEVVKTDKENEDLENETEHSYLTDEEDIEENEESMQSSIQTNEEEKVEKGVEYDKEVKKVKENTVEETIQVIRGPYENSECVKKVGNQFVKQTEGRQDYSHQMDEKDVKVEDDCKKGEETSKKREVEEGNGKVEEEKKEDNSPDAQSNEEEIDYTSDDVTVEFGEEKEYTCLKDEEKSEKNINWKDEEELEVKTSISCQMLMTDIIEMSEITGKETEENEKGVEKQHYELEINEDFKNEHWEDIQNQKYNTFENQENQNKTDVEQKKAKQQEKSDSHQTKNETEEEDNEVKEKTLNTKKKESEHSDTVHNYQLGKNGVDIMDDKSIPNLDQNSQYEEQEEYCEAVWNDDEEIEEKLEEPKDHSYLRKEIEIKENVPDNCVDSQGNEEWLQKGNRKGIEEGKGEHYEIDGNQWEKIHCDTEKRNKDYVQKERGSSLKNNEDTEGKVVWKKTEETLENERQINSEKINGIDEEEKYNYQTHDDKEAEETVHSYQKNEQSVVNTDEENEEKLQEETYHIDRLDGAKYSDANDSQEAKNSNMILSNQALAERRPDRGARRKQCFGKVFKKRGRRSVSWPSCSTRTLGGPNCWRSHIKSKGKNIQICN